MIGDRETSGDDVLDRWMGSGIDLAERIAALADRYRDAAVPRSGDPATSWDAVWRAALDDIATDLDDILSGTYDPRDMQIVDVLSDPPPPARLTGLWRFVQCRARLWPGMRGEAGRCARKMWHRHGHADLLGNRWSSRGEGPR